MARGPSVCVIVFLGAAACRRRIQPGLELGVESCLVDAGQRNAYQFAFHFQAQGAFFHAAQAAVEILRPSSGMRVFTLAN